MKTYPVDHVAVDHVVRQLIKLVAEHGAPNTFGCSELMNPAIKAMRIGRVGVRHLDKLRERLHKNGATFAVTYRNRRFVVEPAVKP